jgi:hypothetical protein
MIRGLMIVAAAGLALAACSRTNEAPAPTLSIGPKGAMGVTRALPFDAAALGPAFAGLDLAGGQAEAEGQRYAIFAVRSGDEIVYTVAAGSDGARVGSVATRSPLVVGPNRETVGQADFAAAPRAQTAFCSDEFFDGQPAFACSTAADGVFWRVYLKIISDGAPEAGELAEMSAEAKAQSPLVEMRWLAAR